MTPAARSRTAGVVRSCTLTAAMLVAASACVSMPPECELEVTATAYNSHRSQTNRQPKITAWGDRLEPGIRAIAVSRDLIRRGLRHKKRVRIDGLPGEYVVLDKMARRWTKRIDIYMGDDLTAAREWGRRRVTIRWVDDRPDEQPCE